jgi:hypothetical protein
VIRASLLVTACLVLTACGNGGAAEDSASRPGVESSVERGPVTMTVRAAPADVTVGERLVLTVEVVAPDGVAVKMPVLEDALGAFAVRSARTPPDVPEGGWRRHTHDYQLDTFASGEVEIPALTLSFTDARGDPIEGTLESEPLVITVGSVLAGDERETDYRDIKDTVAVPVESPAAARWLPWSAIAAVAVAIAVIAFVLLRRRRRGAAAERVVPPHEWARAELDRLAGDRLVEQARFHEFYFRLTDIVRQYIERRFAIMAPEQTTEEFLRAVRADPVLTNDHKDLLGRFLRAADMVKFARHEPTGAEADAAFAAARGFVRETAPVAAEADDVEAAA